MLSSKAIIRHYFRRVHIVWNLDKPFQKTVFPYLMEYTLKLANILNLNILNLENKRKIHGEKKQGLSGLLCFLT